MDAQKAIPMSQPTDSEAIVAAQRSAETPATPLVAPVALPVDKAAALAPGTDRGVGAAPSKP